MSTLSLPELRTEYRAHKSALLDTLKTSHAAERSVRPLLGKLSKLTDGVLTRLWQNAGMDSAMALLAVGGYGRGELFPHSDVDVLVLMPNAFSTDDDTALKQRIETFIGSCWDAGLEIGATTTLQTIIDDAQVQAYADGVVVKAILDTASRNTREAATFAGSIVASDGKSPLLATLFALGAQLTIRSLRTQTVPLEEFSPQADTLILSVTLPALPADAHAAYEKVARTPADLPIVCVAALKTADVTRLALGGVGEQMVVIDAESPTIEEAVELAQASIEPPTDYFASGDYRREMIGVLVKRVLA